MACWSLGAAEALAPRLDDARFYDLVLEQQVAWASAGDNLTFGSRVEFGLAFRVAAIKPESLGVVATVLSVKAESTGPGISERIDTLAADPGESKLLGALAALPGVTWTLTIDPRDGRVTACTGGEPAVDAVNRRFPAAAPGEAPPLAAAAQSAYTGAAMGRVFEGCWRFAGPADEAVPLPAPFTAANGALHRTWGDDGWRFAALAAPLPVTLHSGLNAAGGTLDQLDGVGKVVVEGGWPKQAEGRIAFRLNLTALTQPVTSTHTTTWLLQRRNIPTKP